MGPACPAHVWEGIIQLPWSPCSTDLSHTRVLRPFLTPSMLWSAPLTHRLTLMHAYLQELIQLQTGDSRWGQHAQRVAEGDMWNPPGNGGHDDKAHPPIHPTKYSPGTVLLPSA